MAWNLELLRRLNNGGVPFVIIGGVAAIAHGSARLTEDVDLCVPLTHENAVQIIRAFRGLNPRWRMRPDLPIVTEDSENLRGLKNMYLRTDLGQIDILGELPGVCGVDELEARSVEMIFAGIPCRVLDIDTLIQAKEFAGREKDRPALTELKIIREDLRKRGVL
jgi:hypothetical protein